VTLHAADIGRVVAACIGFLDPGLVVLGGGVGQNPMILNEVQRTARDLTWSTEIAVSSLGVNGTALGAMRLAADFSLAQVIGEPPYPVVVSPPLEPAERR
jgi:predicted NBD/HSP70 family sugar kinase